MADRRARGRRTGVATLAIELALEADQALRPPGSGPRGPEYGSGRRLPVRLMARLVQPGKQGGWVGGSLSWDKLGGYGYYSGPTATQVRLLRELVALYRTRVGSPGSYYPGGDERSIELSAFRLARPRRAVPEPLQEMALAGQRLVIPAARIGQTRNVIVYRLIARDTIEEKVMALKARKGELFASVIDEGNVFGGRLDADDIRGLLA